ncbi:MAG: glycosyltransferase 61 family protein [Elusimicrobiota bacterium]|nr:glycosyltransferase 61 family protein [Elusimicrobiota bacterium]
MSRTKLSGSKFVIGEKEIEKIFKNNGFKIIYPEQLTIRQQIGLMKNCKHLAGIVGTALHLSLFAKNGIEITVIYRTEDIFRAQIKINEMKNFKCNYVDAHINFPERFNVKFPFAVSDKKIYTQKYLMDMGFIPKFKINDVDFLKDINSEDDIVRIIGLDKIKKLPKLNSRGSRIKMRLLMFATNFIPIKSIRRNMRYKFTNR